jgi:hypothetical protein
VLVLVFIPLLFGYLLAAQALHQPRWLLRAGLGLSLATALTLLPLNALMRFTNLGLHPSLNLILSAQCLLSLALWRRPREPGQWDRAQAWALLPTALIYFSSLAYRLMSTDDDFYVHAPVQGMLSRGMFPPYNPFFIEIPLNGHYGRDLLLGGSAALLGCTVIMVEVMSTALWQAATYVIFWAALHEQKDPSWSDHLAPLLIFFGVNCGLNCGLNFLPLNNNPIAYLYVATCFWFFLHYRRHITLAVAGLWGLTLGGLAIVYETHFGLAVLATACASLILRPTPKFFGQLMLPAALAAALALTQGGPLTHLAQRKKEAPKLSQGMQNQSQVVTLRVPKAELFQIKLYSDNNAQARLSLFYQHFAPASWRKLRPEAGYTPIWKWEFLKLHFLPVYLAPLTGWVLWRRQNPAGLWLWFFGLWAFLTPALVNFGPVYESEYMRWEFAAAMAWAACLGLVCSLESRNKFWVVSVALCLLPAVPTASAQLQALSIWPGPKSWLLWPPSGAAWLELQGDPEFRPMDVEMATRLRALSRPYDRILVDSDLENHKTLVYESTLTGLTGVRCVGHSFPLDEEEIGLPPYRQSPATGGFWHRPNLDSLRQLQVQWVLRRVPPATPALEALPKPLIFRDAVLERQLYDLRDLGPDLRNYSPGPPRSLSAAVSGPESTRACRVYPAQLRLQGPAPSWLALASHHDQQLDPRNWLWNPAGPSLSVMAPTSERAQQMQLYGQDESGIFAISDARMPIQVDYHQRVSQLKPTFSPLKPALPNQVIGVDVQFSMTSLQAEPDNRWLVGLEFIPQAHQERVDSAQGPRARLQRKAPDAEGRLSVVGQVPAKVGPYQVNLVVDADGENYLRWSVGRVEVLP